MTATPDLLACLAAVIGPLPDTTAMPYVEAREPDDNEWLSASDEERLQRRYDQTMTERWGPQA